MRTFSPNIHVRSFVRTFLELVDVWSVMRTETAEKSSVHKCQILAVLDRTFDSIYQGPIQYAVWGKGRRAGDAEDPTPSNVLDDKCHQSVKTPAKLGSPTYFG